MSSTEHQPSPNNEAAVREEIESTYWTQMQEIASRGTNIETLRELIGAITISAYNRGRRDEQEHNARGDERWVQ